MKLKRRLQKITVLILNLRHRFHWSVFYSIMSDNYGIENFNPNFKELFYGNSEKYTIYGTKFGNLLFCIDAFAEFESTESPLQLIGIYNAMYIFENIVMEISELVKIEYEVCKNIRDNRNDFFAHPNQQKEHRKFSHMQYWPWKEKRKKVMNFFKYGDNPNQHKSLEHNDIEKDIKLFIDKQTKQLQLCFDILDAYIKKYYPKRIKKDWTMFDILSHSSINGKTFSEILLNKNNP